MKIRAASSYFGEGALTTDVVPLAAQVEQKAWSRFCLTAGLVVACVGFSGIVEGANIAEKKSRTSQPGAAELRLNQSTGLERMTIGNYGWTALMEASVQGNLAVVQDLLAKKADVNAQDVTGGTALKAATYYGHVDIVKALLAHGVDVNLRDERGSTALSDAVLKGHSAIAYLLLNKGADPNVKTVFGDPLIYLAVGMADEAIVRSLLDRGADPNAKPERGLTTLIAAIHGGHQGIISALLEKGADINAKDRDQKSVFHLAAEKGLTSVVQYALSRGADPNEPDPFGNSPLMLAVGGAHVPVVKLLLEKGANISATNRSGYGALHAVASNGSVELLELVLKHGANVNERTISGTTALMLAAAQDHLDAVRFLIERGAEIDAADAEGNTALVAADWAGHSEVVNELLRKENSAVAKGVQEPPSTLLYFQRTDRTCDFKSFNPEIGRSLLLLALADCPGDVFVALDRNTILLVRQSEIEEITFRPRVSRMPPIPLPLENTALGGFGKHHMIQAGYFQDGSLGVLYEGSLEGGESAMRVYKFHEGHWALVDQKRCPAFQDNCLKAPILGARWKHWARERAIWHPKLLRNPFVVKRGLAVKEGTRFIPDRKETHTDELNRRWQYLQLRVKNRRSTLYYDASSGDMSFGPYTFRMFLQTHKDRNPREIIEDQNDTALVHKFLLVNVYFGSGIRLIDLETGEEPIKGIEHAFWVPSAH